MKKKTREVEFLCARDDNTWDTYRTNVPVSVGTTDAELVKWAREEILTTSPFRNCVLIAVYSYQM